jgi:putative transcriptional regulator
MTKPKRKKKRKQPFPSQDFLNLKGPKRERLILERKAKGLTQGQLAEFIGCSAATVSHLELGRMKPSLELSLELVMPFGLPFEILLPDL